MSTTTADVVAQRALHRLRVAHAVIGAVPEVMDRYFAPDVCILATRIGLEVLRYFDITDAYPQSVTCRVMNAEARELLESGREDEMWQRLKEAKREEPGGPWLMAVNTEEAKDGRFPGHVGIVVPVGHESMHAMFLDLTAPQFNRPHKGIELEAIIVRLEPDWFDESLPTDHPRTAVLVNSTLVGYCPVPDHPGDTSFTNSPDWLWPRTPGRQTIYRRVTGEAIRATRDRLATHVLPLEGSR